MKLFKCIIVTLTFFAISANGSDVEDNEAKKAANKVFDGSSISIYLDENEIVMNLSAFNELEEDIYILFDYIEYINLTRNESIDTVESVSTPFTSKIILTHKKIDEQLNFKYVNECIIDSFPTYQRLINNEKIRERNKTEKSVFLPIFHADITIKQDPKWLMAWHNAPHICYGKIILYYFKESDIPKIKEELGIKLVNKIENAEIENSYEDKKNWPIPSFNFKTKELQNVFRLWGNYAEIKIKDNDKVKEVFSKYIKKMEEATHIWVLEEE